MTQARASAFGELDIWLARAGRHEQLYAKLGAHVVDGGVRFAVWAPNAQYVSVIGDFNDWDSARARARARRGDRHLGRHRRRRDGAGEHYKFHLDGREKADPMAFEAELPPKTASVVFESSYEWNDDDWIDDAAHAGAARAADERSTRCTRRRGARASAGAQLADELAPYVRDLGFTHVELLPVMHHPYSGSWGYQVTGFYAPVSTMGSPDDFRYFVDHMHANGIGVLLDWVPAHFATDPWALTRFDGTALYEHDDPRRGEHPDWGTYVFNLGRSEVQNFLLANALFWLREYHADGIRVDAVASMLYLDYSRKDGEWVPNAFGGREDLDAVAFLKELNELVHAREPGVISAAEESTAWPGVSRPTYVGGLGFGFKWNMGWMHDTLELLPARPDPPPLPPSRADLLARLRVERELHPPALARRGRARQGLDAREDAGRPLAAAREPALALRVHVVASRQEAALHGRRARDAVGVGARRTSCRGGCSSTPSTRACAT